MKLKLSVLSALSACLLSMAVLPTCQAQQMTTIHLASPIYPAYTTQCNAVTGDVSYWINNWGCTVYVRGVWMGGGASGQTQYELDMWGGLFVNSNDGTPGLEIYNFEWDRYQYPTAPMQGPTFFPKGLWFAVQPGQLVEMRTGAQAYPSWTGYQSVQFWCTFYLTTTCD